MTGKSDTKAAFGSVHGKKRETNNGVAEKVKRPIFG
jgi:hypothetical protein